MSEKNYPDWLHHLLSDTDEWDALDDIALGLMWRGYRQAMVDNIAGLYRIGQSSSGQANPPFGAECAARAAMVLAVQAVKDAGFSFAEIVEPVEEQEPGFMAWMDAMNPSITEDAPEDGDENP